MEKLQTIRGAEILLVEDNRINQELTKEILKHEGFVVSVANNGNEAVAMVAESGKQAVERGKRPYDLVLMDLQMPVMDGYAATREIRKMDTAINTIPVIAMTADTMTGDMEKCIAAGMNGHVAKPIDQNKLFATMTQWIGPVTPSSVKADDEDSENDGFPDALPGIDITEGLSRVGGNPSFFKNILVKFAVRNKNTVTDIRSALETDDRKTAMRCAHTLKGLAGSIGAHELQATAAALEADIEEEKESLTDALTHLSEALDQVLSGLSVLHVGDAGQTL